MWIAKPSKTLCLNCGKGVKKSGNNVKWCSTKCRDRYKRIQAGAAPLPTQINCAWCQKQIINPRALTQKYCSKACAMKAFRRSQSRVKAKKRNAKAVQLRSQVTQIDQIHLSIDETAARLRVNIRTIQRLIKKKKLKAIKVFRRTIIRECDIIQFMQPD